MDGQLIASYIYKMFEPSSIKACIICEQYALSLKMEVMFDLKMGIYSDK